MPDWGILLVMDDTIIETLTLTQNEKAPGRSRITKEQQAALLDEFEDSEMSAAKFCRQHRLVYPTFSSWRAKRRKKEKSSNGRKTESSMNLTEVFIAAPLRQNHPAGNDALVVDLPGGASMRVDSSYTASLAALLIDSLGGSSQC
jgi:hypothetical protein